MNFYYYNRKRKIGKILQTVRLDKKHSQQIKFYILQTSNKIFQLYLKFRNEPSKFLFFSNKTKYQNLTWRYLNDTLIEIPSKKACNVSTDQTKEKITCYQGKCVSKLVPLNETHKERVAFCLCSEVKYTFDI